MAKTQSFISNSRMILKDGKTVERGELLKLEVGDDNLPTEQIYRDRVSAVKDNSTEDDGDSKKAAKASAKEITDKAKADAKATGEKAEADASALIEKAKADAKKIVDDAQAQANEILSKAANGQK